jgi:hypothetical protein
MSLAASLVPAFGLGECVRAGSSRRVARADARVARSGAPRAFARTSFAKRERIGLVARASGDAESSGSSASVETTDPPATGGGGRFKRRAPDAPPPKPSPLGAGPDAAKTSSIKVIPVEQRSRDAFQGVAKVDEEDTRVRAVALVAGDIAALMLFAAIGRGNHGEGVFLADVAATAAPFAAGWFLASPVAGTFGLAARGAKVGPAAAAAAKGWALGIPAGLVFRGIAKGAVPPKPFVIVSLAATGVFLIGWRAWFAKSAGGDVDGNKKGNPLEFMGLLMSLTKRW